MVSRYHWLTTGVDTQFNNSLPTAQCLPINLPAGANLKRFMLRQTRFQAKASGNDNNNIFPLAITMDVSFTSGPNSGRSIYQSYRDVPFEQTTFVPIAGDSRICWWHADDLQLGFNQKTSYGLQSGAAANLQFTYGTIANRFSVISNLFGEFSFNFAALYYL